jgi:hypothetical protein
VEKGRQTDLLSFLKYAAPIRDLTLLNPGDQDCATVRGWAAKGYNVSLKVAEEKEISGLNSILQDALGKKSFDAAESIHKK